jgi:hypothetical protein
MKIRMVVNYVPRYRRGHRFHFVPPVTGVHLAAITPREHEVELVHEQVREGSIEHPSPGEEPVRLSTLRARRGLDDLNR